MDVVEVSRERSIHLSAYFLGDVTTMAIGIQTSGKPSVYTEFAFQLMCNDAANLDLIAFGLEVLDQGDGAVTIAQGGIEDDVPASFNCGCTQLLGPLACIVVGMASPGVRILLAQALDVGVRIA